MHFGISRVSRKRQGFERKGAWTVVGGSGKYLGMTGSGTYLTGSVVDRKKTSHWEGEVDIPE